MALPSSIFDFVLGTSPSWSSKVCTLHGRTLYIQSNTPGHVRVSRLYPNPHTRQLYSTLNSPTLSSLVPRLFLVVLRSALSPPCGRCS
jgi:hypothetical protein